MPLADLILIVFCMVDDALQQPDYTHLRTRGPQPGLHDSEVLTMEIIGSFLKQVHDTDLFRYFRIHHHQEFPQIKTIHRTTFARQSANLYGVKGHLQERIAAELLNGDNGIWLTDSMPLPACKFSRAKQCRRLGDCATFGYDHSARNTFFGLRLHVRVSRSGVILGWNVESAHISEVAVLAAAKLRRGSIGIGDRGYHSPKLRAKLAEQGIEFHAPFKTRKHDRHPEYSKFLSHLRWMVETVQGQLSERYGAKRTLARDKWHLQSRISRAILSHTIMTWVCRQYGIEGLNFDRILAA